MNLNQLGRPAGITRFPSNKDLGIVSDNELHTAIQLHWNLAIPRHACSPEHTAPFQALADAFFARAPVTVWKASRGFGGKSTTMSALVVSEAAFLGAEATVLGGSAAQSMRVHEATHEAWEQPHAPKKLIKDGGLTQWRTRLNNGGGIVALMASQRSVRGPHPQRLRLDEIDEMELGILESAQGQPMSARGITTQTVMSSTHQYPDGTMSEILARAEERGWPVYQWCYKCNLTTNGGWLEPLDVERKRVEITQAMWDAEYDLQEPSFEGRAIATDRVDAMFDREFCPNPDHPDGEWKGDLDEMLIFDLPRKGASYVTSADWAKDQDFTVIQTWRIDTYPWEMVAFCRTARRPWTEMIDLYAQRLEMYPERGVHDDIGVGDVVDDILQARFSGNQVEGISLHAGRKDLAMTALVKAVEDGALRSPFIESMHREFRYATYAQLYGREHTPDSIIAAALAWTQRRHHFSVAGAFDSNEDYQRDISPWTL